MIYSIIISKLLIFIEIDEQITKLSMYSVELKMMHLFMYQINQLWGCHLFDSELRNE